MGNANPTSVSFPFILDAYKKAAQDAFTATDDAAIAEHAGARVRVVEGSTRNIKVTYPEDLKMAEVFLNL